MSSRTVGLPRSDFVARALARDRLGGRALVCFVLAAAAPLTVLAGVVPTGLAVTGVTGIPLAFLLIGAVLGLFSVGYVAMARHVPNSGAFYAYIAQGLGRPLGVGAAGVALLAYNALQVALYGAIGAAAGPLLRQWFGITAAWWVIALAAWLLVTTLGVLRVDLNGRVLALLLAAEIAVIIVYDLAYVTHPAGGHLSFDTLTPTNLATAAAGALFVMAGLGFIGFESAAVYSEESRNPGRTVPVATFTAVALIAVLYGVSSWAMIAAAGSDQVVATAQAQGPEVVFALAGAHLGGPAADIGHALFVTSLVAAMVSFHGTTARYMYALGREGVLPAALGATSHAGAPKTASLAQSGLALAVITLFAAVGWDPLVQLFFWGGTGGGYGVLFLITLTSIAVIAYFTRHHPTEDNTQRRATTPALVASAVAAVALAAVMWLATSNFDTLLGVTPDSPVRTLIPLTYAAALLLGIGWALLLKHSRPQVYARIGWGAKAATTAINGFTHPATRPAAGRADLTPQEPTP